MSSELESEALRLRIRAERYMDLMVVTPGMAVVLYPGGKGGAGW